MCPEGRGARPLAGLKPLLTLLVQQNVVGLDVSAERAEIRERAFLLLPCNPWQGLGLPEGPPAGRGPGGPRWALVGLKGPGLLPVCGHEDGARKTNHPGSWEAASSPAFWTRRTAEKSPALDAEGAPEDEADPQRQDPQAHPVPEPRLHRIVDWAQGRPNFQVLTQRLLSEV